MAARFWVLGTGNTSSTSHWSTSSGGAGGASVPVDGDTVFFDSNSGTAATVTVDSAMTATSVSLDKSDMILTLSAPLNTSTAAVTIVRGTFRANAQTCSWFALSSNDIPSVNNARTIDLGSSHITVTSTTQPWLFATSTHLTFIRGTSTITFSGNGPALLSLGSQYYYKGIVSNVGSASMSIAGGTNRFESDFTILGGNSRTGVVQAQNLIVDGKLTITGQSELNRVLFQSSAPGNRRTITAGTRDLSNVTFQDITAAGAAAPFSGTGLGDAGGNANISFDDPMNLYRNGDGGNYSDVTKWATDDTDDGTPTGTPLTPRVPLAQDIVKIDDRATGTINVDMARLGSSLDTSGFAGTLAPSISVTVYGSVTLSNDPAFTITPNSTTLILGGRGTQLLTSSGKTIPLAVKIEAPGGTYQLQDDLTIDGALTHTFGTLDANDHNPTMASYSSTTGNNARMLLMKSGVWTLTGTGTIWNVTSNASFVLNRGTSTILVADTSSAAKVFIGNGRTYRDFEYAYSAGVGSLTMGGSVFSTITWPRAANIILTADTTTTVRDLLAVGAPGELINISSTVPGTNAVLTKAGGVVLADYLSLTDSKAAGTALWYAGSHSVDNGGNLGWQFTDQPSSNGGMMPFFFGNV